MKPAIHGVGKLKYIDLYDKRLDNLRFQHVIIGTSEFKKVEKSIINVNKDKVCIFVDRANSFVTLYNKGYRKVFFSEALDCIDVDSIIEAQNMTSSDIEAQFSYLKKNGLKAEYGEALTAVRVLEIFMSRFRSDDNDGIREILETQYDTVINNIKGILELSETYDELQSFIDLRKNNVLLERELASLKEKLESVSGNESISEADIFNSKQYRDLEEKLEEVNRNVISERQKNKELSEKLSNIANEKGIAEANIQEQKSDNTKQFIEFEQQIRSLQDELAKSIEKVDELEFSIAGYEAEKEDALRKVAEGSKAYDVLKQRSDKYVTEIQTLKDVIVKQKALLEKTGYDPNKEAAMQEEISSLKASLEEYSKNIITNASFKKYYPIIGPNFMINALHVVVIKEIKHAVYMNTFLDTLDNALGRSLKQNGKSHIILVLDTLMDDFRVAKYQSQRFAINAAPDRRKENTKYVSVINKLNVEFLKNVIGVNNYDYVFIVDRMGINAAPVQLKSNLSEIYLIDSAKDITDFSLKNKKKIFFGSQETAGCIAAITLNSFSNMFDTNDDTRQYHMATVVDAILKEARIQI